MSEQFFAPNPWWLKGTSIFMGLMFLFSLTTIASALATPQIVGAFWPEEWSEIAGEYPENGTTEQKEEWEQGEIFWNESIGYWEDLADSGLFEITAGFGILMTLISAASVPILWSGDRDLGLKLCYFWVATLMMSQVITTMIYYDVGFIPEYSEFDLEEELEWLYLVEGVGLAFSLAQIVICNSCLFASIFVVSARSKVSQNKYDLISGFHRSEK